LEDMTVTIWLRELWDSSVNLVFRFYVLTADYWPVWHDVLEKVKLTFDEHWVSFPYPQQDVHHYNHEDQVSEKNMNWV
jgi:small conductance mechanosensitive channel